MLLTAKQLATLAALKHGPLTTAELAAALGRTANNEHGRLRRLEDRWMVRRINEHPCRWELTASGREALRLA